MKKNGLESTRQQIDALDVEIMERISRRAALALETAHAKQSAGAFYDPAREAQVLRRIRETNPGPLTDDGMMRLFREIMSACLALEHPTRVAYLGPEGTFTHQAAQRHFGHAADISPHDNVDEVFREVESRQSEYGVVPVENSTDGVVAHTLDLFINSPLQIAGEVELAVHHHLLAGSEDRTALRCVRAHPQALAQCRQWLDRELPNLDRISDPSNAAAARYATDHPDTAAIASRAAAEQYDLKILAANIEDNPNNRTRFLILGLHDQAPSGEDKTSVLVSAHNQPGALLGLLRPLADADIDLTRIESRPTQAINWEYVFFLDIRGHKQDPEVAQALKSLHEAAAFCKVLGSYPCALG
ncbi:MAG: prephenate dehydratase [Gammaproteobacteria bacterium]|nr:prephenate dehydratase [Gammaproteobacteria bacterium]